MVKLGGSILTDKKHFSSNSSYADFLHYSQNFYHSHQAINSKAKEMRYLIQKYAYISFGIVHGVGPFGHFVVKKHREMPFGVSFAYGMERFLHEIVKKSFTQEGVSIRTVDPFSRIFHDRNQEYRYDEFLYEFGMSWKRKKTPITYGCRIISFSEEGEPDIIEGYKGKIGSRSGQKIYTTGKYKPLSGDLMCLWLAKEFNADKIIMATDVEGVVGEDGQIIRRITPYEETHLKKIGQAGVDVTGGMQNKVDILREAAKNGIEGNIVDGRVEGNIEKAMNGLEVGTLFSI